MLSNLLILGAAFSTSAYAATVSAYGQCGGQGWTGGTTCVSGYTCTYSNPYYSQCLAGAAGTTTKAAATTAKTTAKAATTTTTTKAATSSVAASSGTTYKASFTEYGSTDDNGSGNCNVATTACGFYTYVSPPLIRSSNELPSLMAKLSRTMDACGEFHVSLE